MQNEIEVKRLAGSERKDKEWSGHVKIWWTNADCDASEEVADFPYGADEEDLEAAVRQCSVRRKTWNSTLTNSPATWKTRSTSSSKANTAVAGACNNEEG